MAMQGQMNYGPIFKNREGVLRAARDRFGSGMKAEKAAEEAERAYNSTMQRERGTSADSYSPLRASAAALEAMGARGDAGAVDSLIAREKKLRKSREPIVATSVPQRAETEWERQQKELAGRTLYNQYIKSFYS
jgi:hypothetical protein